jgi:hypothetical protein
VGGKAVNHVARCMLANLSWAIPLAIVGSLLTFVFAREYGKRSCADPNAWAQGSYGRAVAECEAKGGKIRERSWQKELVCEWTKEETVP